MLFNFGENAPISSHSSSFTNLRDYIYIYWTSEPDRDQALMEVPFNNNDAVSAGEYFDGIVITIQKKDFEIKRMPEAKVCSECDFRRSCVAKGLISLKQKC